MAHITADRVRDTSTSTGTGNFTVSGTAPIGFRTLSAVLAVSDTFYYAIQLQGGGEWEVGTGTYSSANTFSRTTVLSSSNAGSAVNFSAGTKDVFLTLAAARTVQSDASGSVGTIQFAAGTVSAPAITTVGDTNTGIFFPAADTIAFSTAGTEDFRIGSVGQFGIGGATYGTSGQVFTSGGASAAPTWSTISVSTVSGTLPVANGGTNLTSYTVGDLIYASGATTLAKLADVATGNALISGGVGVAPSWGKIGLTTHISGTLPIANGGTNLTTTPTNGQLLIGNGTGYSLAALTASTGVSVTNGSGTITIANTGVTSLTAGTNISVSGSTGAVTVNTTAAPTFSTSVTSPLVIGGTAASSSLTLQSTSGIGTTDSILFKVGNNGATTAMSIATGGQITVGSGTAGAPVLSPTGDTNTGILFPAADNVAISTGGVTRFTVGNAGIVSRVYSAASDTSISVDPSLYDQYVWTALAGTLTFNASTTGSPTNGTKLIFRIKDNGTTRTLTWTTTGAGSYRAIGVTLPTSTTANKVIYVGCIYNSTESFWDVVAVQVQA